MTLLNPAQAMLQDLIWLRIKPFNSWQITFFVRDWETDLGCVKRFNINRPSQGAALVILQIE